MTNKPMKAENKKKFLTCNFSKFLGKIPTFKIPYYRKRKNMLFMDLK